MSTIKNSNMKLLFCAAGIFICYFYYGMLQERITRGSYGKDDNKEKFTYMFTLVFFQCVVNYIFAKILLMTIMKEDEDNTKNVYYFISALTYFLAMVCSNMALQFVNYPTQVVGKAGKPIPVMILGVLLGRKSYPMKKYLFVILIVLGVIMFMFKEGKKATRVLAEESVGFGEFLLLLSLLMDGLTSAVQERMKSEHKTKSGHMMLNMNFWSIIFSGIVILISGELFGFIKFLQRNPNCLWQIMTLSVTSAVGQFFIFLTVTEFGPLPCSIITTTRKLFTVLASVLIFGNALLPRQWLGTAIVFSSLFLDAYYSKSKNIKKESA